MIYNVVPINYMGGTGGQFLSSLIYAAAHKKDNTFVFSENGNSHDSKKYLGSPPLGIGKDLTGKTNLNFLREFAKTIPEDTIVYPHGHYANPDVLMEYFHKQIKTCFEVNQLSEIIGVFMLKHPEQSLKFKNVKGKELHDLYNIDKIVKWRYVVGNYFTRLCRPCPDLEPRMLNVSWNELVYLDPEILISKISDFTKIPSEDFSRDAIANWRELTQQTIDRLKQADLI